MCFFNVFYCLGKSQLHGTVLDFQIGHAVCLDGNVGIRASYCGSSEIIVQRYRAKRRGCTTIFDYYDFGGHRFVLINIESV